MRRLNCWLCAVAALALATLVLSTHAQQEQPWARGGQKWAQKPKGAVDISADGTLKGFTPAVAQVLGGKGEQWLVKVTNNVAYNGMAEADWLRPGMFVEFAGSFDVKGQSTAPLTQLSIFTPSKDRPLGARADAGLTAAAVDLFKSEDPKEAKKPVVESVSLKVAGRITGMRDNKISVAAGNANVVAEVADTCTIYISVNDASLARPDDTIRMEGWHLPNDPTHIYATKFTINGKSPLTSKPPVAVKPVPDPATPAEPGAPAATEPATTPAATAISKEAQQAALDELENPAAGDKQ